ncbi:MAG: hypothetical protein J6K92_05625 [Oscillospiraceae bacterium]|nr:hypothetical protein [Oscillospiraceae bacterium]
MAKDKKVQSKSTAPAEAAKTAETVKAAPAAKTAEVKPAAEVKPVSETKAPAAVKAEKPAAKKVEKPAAKKAEKPAAKKPAEVKKDVFVIQGSGEHTSAEIIELCKAAYKDGSRKHVKSIDVYVKAENGEMRAYYVINGNAEGKYIVL